MNIQFSILDDVNRGLTGKDGAFHHLTVFISCWRRSSKTIPRGASSVSGRRKTQPKPDEIGCDRVLFVYYGRLTPPGEPFALRAIWAARGAMRSSYVVAGMVVTRTQRGGGPCRNAAENYSTNLAPSANYTIHLLPILRRLYYTACSNLTSVSPAVADFSSLSRRLFYRGQNEAFEISGANVLPPSHFHPWGRTWNKSYTAVDEPCLVVICLRNTSICFLFWLLIIR